MSDLSFSLQGLAPSLGSGCSVFVPKINVVLWHLVVGGGITGIASGGGMLKLGRKAYPQFCDL